MSAFINFDAFDPRSISLGPVNQNQYGGNFVPFQDPLGRRAYLKIMTPPMHLPFGITESKFDTDNFYIDLSFRGADVDPAVREFQERLTAFDDYLLEAAVANAAKWFPKKKLPADAALAASILDSPDCHKRSIKPPSDPKWAPTMKVKARMLPDGGIDCKFFDRALAPITKDDVVKGSTVRLVVEASSVYLTNAGWGVTWRARQAQLTSPPQRLDDCAFTSFALSPGANGAEHGDDVAVADEVVGDDAGSTSTGPIDETNVTDETDDGDLVGEM